MSGTETGVAWPASGPAPGIDPWSQRVYDALKDWATDVGGQWARWEPGYLVLTIEAVGGEAVDPVILDTADDEVTVAFGGWHDHLDGWPEALTSEASAEEARNVLGRWLDGSLQTLYFVGSEGRWCGSSLVVGEDVVEAARRQAQSLRDLSPVRVEIRSLHQRDWIHMAVDPAWLVPPRLSPDRLP